MSQGLGHMLTRLLGIIRKECPEAWQKLTAVSDDLKVSVTIDGETFALVGGRGGLSVQREVPQPGALLSLGLVALRRILMGEMALVDCLRGGDVLLRGSARDVGRLERLAWLIVAGAARSPSAAPMLDELLNHEPTSTEKDVAMDPQENPPQPEADNAITCDVVVLGAGIAGLTAAHELAERGFKVVVMDPNIKPRSASDSPEDENPGIGGMARSQWGFIPVIGSAPRSPKSTGEMVSVLPRPAWKAIIVDYSVTRGVVTLADSTRDYATKEPRGPLSDELKSLKETLTAIQRDTFPLAEIALTISGSRDEAVEAAVLERLDKEDTFVTLTALNPEEEEENGTAIIEINLFPLPGEHGFRFFPSFYRHVFDTMRRIPLSTREDERVRATAYDNLIPTREIGYVGKNAARSVRVPRQKLASMEEGRRLIEGMLQEAEYTETDIKLLGLKFLKYATSCRKRREAEYENVSWYEFVEGDRFSRRGRDLHESAPGTLGGLAGSLADARTQGTIALQLMKDSMGTGEATDMLLDGPTDVAWFAHWYRYLRTQGVEFFRGRLHELRKDGPVVYKSVPGGEVVQPFKPRSAAIRGKVRYVVALPIVAAHEHAVQLVQKHGATRDDARDFHMLVDFVGKGKDGRQLVLADEVKQRTPEGPIRHLSGIQYFFEQDLRLWQGHTQYLDTKFGLTAISQPQFWREPENRASGFRGLLSVDIGEWKDAWGLSAHKLATAVWDAIVEAHEGDYPGKWPSMPQPYCYHVDENILVDGIVAGNTSPFLVNEKRRFRLRPGTDAAPGDDGRVELKYHVAFDQYVMAGTHMQTATRITSMEAACESGRRAVNALLELLEISGDPCEVWDPEDFEIPELESLKQLDETLYARGGLPHALDILAT